MTHSNLRTEEKPIHFGPVYGRPVMASMRLCNASPLVQGESHSMSRSLKCITCKRCEEIIQELVNTATKAEAA